MTKPAASIQKTVREHAEVVIRRRRFLIVPLIALMLIGVIAAFFVPNTYESSALIQINEQAIIEPLVSRIAVSTKPRNEMDVVAKQIMSWEILARLVDQLKLLPPGTGATETEEYINDLRKRIVVETKEKNIVRVSYQDEDPRRSQVVVNTLARSFIDENSRLTKQEARGAISFIGDQLAIYRQKLESSQRNFSSRKVASELQIAINRRKILLSRLASLRKIIPSTVRVEQNPVVARLQSRLAELEMELSRLSIDALEQHPRVIALKSEIGTVKQRLNTEIQKESVMESVTMSNPSYIQVEQEARQLDMEIGYLEQRKTELRGMTEVQGDTTTVSEDDLAALESGKKVDEDIYQMLLKQIESAYVSERLQQSDQGGAFSVLEYARLPMAPVRTNKVRVIFAGIFLGLMSGIGSVFMMEYLDRSFRTADEAKKVLKMPILGSISRIVVDTSGANSFVNNFDEAKVRKYLQKHRLLSDMRFVSPHRAKIMLDSGIAPQVVIHHEPKSAVAEEFRIVRTNVQNLAFENVMKVIMLTSAVHAEGKSTTSSNLAVSMADAGSKVLLLDCDLRKGTLHDVFNLRQGPGVSDILAGKIEPRDAITETKVHNLSVLTSGPRPGNPSELLGAPAMEKLLLQFKESYDTVIIDAPPVLNLPDSCVLGKYVDGVILVVQAERTQREDVLHACSMLTQSRSNIVGFVLTNVQFYIPKYVYNYLYGT